MHCFLNELNVSEIFKPKSTDMASFTIGLKSSLSHLELGIKDVALLLKWIKKVILTSEAQLKRCDIVFLIDLKCH